MPKYDERFAQEAQEQEYLHLKHLDDEYWYHQFSENLRINTPAIVAMAVDSSGELHMVREHTEAALHALCKERELHVLALYEPKHFI